MVMKKRKVKIKVLCLCCDKEFETNRNAKFCSPRCYRASRRTERKVYDENYRKNHKEQIMAYENNRRKKQLIRIKNCLNCNKEIETSNGRRKFCCRNCNARYWRKIHSRLPKVRNCLSCNKEFDSEGTAKRYCSSKCYWILFNRNHLQDRKKYDDRNINLPNKIVSACINCNKIIYLSKRNVSEKNFCSDNCYHIYYSKEKCPLWKGGISFEPYGVSFTRQLRREIRTRDNYCCQLCGKHKSELTQKLSVHHVDYVKDNNFTFNLISLCNRCHSITNNKRDYFKKLFQDYMADKYGYAYYTQQERILKDIKCED
jgi:hypothetical protein